MMHQMADNFEHNFGGIVSLVSSAATEMQAAAEQAGANVTSVAGTAEELSASVMEIGRQVATSNCQVVPLTPWQSRHNLLPSREKAEAKSKNPVIPYRFWIL